MKFDENCGCLSCNAGYKLDKHGYSVPDNRCTELVNGKCSACEPGYFLASDECCSKENCLICFK